jgi:hypothetical protein
LENKLDFDIVLGEQTIPNFIITNQNYVSFFYFSSTSRSHLNAKYEEMIFFFYLIQMQTHPIGWTLIL